MDHNMVTVTAFGVISVGDNTGFGDTECLPASIGYGAIAPYFALLDVRKGKGKGFYRISSKRRELRRARREVLRGFPAFSRLKLKWMLVLTYLDVGLVEGYFKHGDLNTFQAIVTTDGKHSFAIFYYNKLKWAKKDVPVYPFPGMDRFAERASASAGFDRGDRSHFALFKHSCTKDIGQVLLSESNVCSPGMWIFRIDGPTIQSAGCDPNAKDDHVLRVCNKKEECDTSN
ncbi:nidogen-like domain-containing protein [Ditylenchus destructor]|uniref:Nidogen-like domain-containing protein n=1 Tax=Ditylenchus destructor TaxID=166010 RepID=A0AAD4MLN5_9BILA|nr:nidogen-like domain-containing protein [Ditylenchus destructor]